MPYLAAKSGKAARFSLGDLVSLAAVSEMIDRYGLQIGKVSAAAESLFNKVDEIPPTKLVALTAVLSEQNAMLVDPEEVCADLFDGPTLVSPLRPIVKRLRTGVFPAATSATEQAVLPFPPKAMRAGE